MDFCPSCGKKLIRQKKTERKKVVLLLSCPKCGYEKRATRPITTVPRISNHSPQERIAVLGKREQKLRTFPTIRIKCSRCGNNLAYVWMVQAENWMNLQHSSSDAQDAATQSERTASCRLGD